MQLYNIDVYTIQVVSESLYLVNTNLAATCFIDNGQ